MAGFTVVQEPENAERRYAPLAASQTFDENDPVRLVANKLAISPIDDTEIEDGEIVGIAIEKATGIHSKSRTGAANGFGAQTDDTRSYIPASAHGLVLQTANFWATGAPGTNSAKAGTDIGAVYQVVGNTGGQFGVEKTAAVLSTHVGFIVDNVLDANGMPVNSAGTVAAGTGWIQGRLVGDRLQDEGGS